MTNKGSLKAGSLLSMRNRLPRLLNSTTSMWACCTNHYVLPNFFHTALEAQKVCEKLLEENITAVPKRVNITITFPQSQGDIS